MFDDGDAMFGDDPRYVNDYYDETADPRYRPGYYGGVAASDMYTYDPDEQDRARNQGPRETRIGYDPKFDTERMQEDVRQRTQQELKASPNVMVSEPNQGSDFLLSIPGEKDLSVPKDLQKKAVEAKSLMQKARGFYKENKYAVWMATAIAAYAIYKNQKQIKKFIKKRM